MEGEEIKDELRKCYSKLRFLEDVFDSNDDEIRIEGYAIDGLKSILSDITDKMNEIIDSNEINSLRVHPSFPKSKIFVLSFVGENPDNGSWNFAESMNDTDHIRYVKMEIDPVILSGGKLTVKNVDELQVIVKWNPGDEKEKT